MRSRCWTSSSPRRAIASSEDRVRDLLGLADADTVEAFVDALAAGDVVAGVRILDALEDRGRDLRAFLDQVIEVIRGAIVGAAGAGAEAGRSAPRRGRARPRRPAARRDRPEPGRRGRPPPPARARPLPGRRMAAVGRGVRGAPAPSGARRPTVRRPGGRGPRLVRAGRRAGRRRSRPPPDRRRARRARRRRTPPSARAADAAPRRRPRRRRAGSPTASCRAPRPILRAPAPDPAPAVDLALPVGGDLAVLRDRWPEIVARISKHPPTKPLISVCRPIAVEDGIVTLGFPGGPGVPARRRRASARGARGGDRGGARPARRRALRRDQPGSRAAPPGRRRSGVRPGRGTADLRRRWASGRPGRLTGASGRRDRVGTVSPARRPAIRQTAPDPRRTERSVTDGDGEPAAHGDADAAGDGPDPGRAGRDPRSRGPPAAASYARSSPASRSSSR